jgi:preprotein translocase subunit SecB
VNTLCPHTLFPYARRSITDLVADGGFPPLVLQPINFDQVYAQRMQEAQSEAKAAVDMEVQGNA